MKKTFTIFTLLIIGLTIANAWTVNSSKLKTNFQMVGVQACTLLIPEHRGSVMQYYWFRADSIKDSTPALQVRWQYSIDNLTWTTGATLQDSFGNKNSTYFNTWCVESLGVREYPYLRLIITGARATQRAKFYAWSYILK